MSVRLGGFNEGQDGAISRPLPPREEALQRRLDALEAEVGPLRAAVVALTGILDEKDAGRVASEKARIQALLGGGVLGDATRSPQ